MNTYTEAYEFLISIVGSVPYGIIATDMDGYITMTNEQSLHSLGILLPIGNVLETHLTEYLNNIPDLKEKLEKCFDKGREIFELNEIQHEDKYLSFHAKPIMNGMLLSVNDVTENKNARDAATIALLEGQETERQRLAKEIHDGIGPLMSTIRMNLDAVKSKLSYVPPKTQEQVGAMDDLIQTVAADIRSISHALMPGALIDFGLVQALKGLCDKINQSELVKIEFHHRGFTERLDSNIELNLYRIAQELINNALKYAKAKEIVVQLIKRDIEIMLTVEDDGIGFDANKMDNVLQNGIGMRNIKTRIDVLGGEFTIDSQQGKGVHATAEILLNKEQ